MQPDMNAPAQPAPAAVATPIKGPAQPQNDALQFNSNVQNILLHRIQSLTPPEEQILDAVVTPETLPVFVKILPELKPLFSMMGYDNEGSESITSGGRNPMLDENTMSPVSRGLTGR